MTSRIMKLALAVSVFFLMTGAGFAQDPGRGQRDRDGRHDQGKAQAHNDRGGRHGRAEQERGRDWHPGNNDHSYGWQGRRDNDHDRDDRYRGNNRVYRYPNGTYSQGPYSGYRYPNGTYGQGPYSGYYGGYGYPNGTYRQGPYGGYGNYGGNNAQSVAYNNGFREGVGYGQSDRNNGHSYRPSYSSTYQNGHNGYNSSYGSQMAYKRAYQDGFRAGYDRGYNSGGGRRY